MKRLHAGSLPAGRVLVVLGVLIGIAGVALALWPVPPSAAVNVKAASDRAIAEREEVQRLERTLSQHLWAGGPESVEPGVLSLVSQAAAAAGARVTTFRPQRVSEVEGLTVSTLFVSVEASYASVVRMLDLLEKPNGRVLVNQVQISGTDDGSGGVKAGIGLTVYTQGTASSAARTKEANRGSAI